MTSAEEICFLPAVEMARFFRDGSLSPVEVVEALLARIEQLAPRINAFTVVLGDEARQEARAAEARLARRESLPPLHGIPFTLKDLTETAGIRTGLGSRAFAANIPPQDNILLRRLRQAGGILLGKTTTPELGHKAITDSPLTGTTNNPWNLAYTTGGSSGGAAAGVAAGMGPLAQGSDGAGSIRIPASCCGVVGLKPSLGVVPFERQGTGFGTLSVLGPIARTVSDTALLQSILAGPDDSDPISRPSPPIPDAAALNQASVRGWRVAYSPNLGWGPVDPEAEAAARQAAQILASDLGAAVEEESPQLPNPEEAMDIIWSVTMGVSGRDNVLSRVGSAEADPVLLGIVERGQGISAFDYYRAAHGFRSRYYAGMLAFFQRFDLLLTPTLRVAPFPHPAPAPGPDQIQGVPVDPLFGWVLTYPFNLTGQPAISVPAGFSAAGLPLGLQIAGRPNADAQVLQAAAAYEAAAPWQHLHP